MKTAIVGVGAIGGMIGTCLAASGATQVSALARGETLAALRRHGFRLHMDGQNLTSPVTASDRADELGVQDLLIISVKGPSLPALAPTLRPLIGPQTLILPMMNGVPWWFCLVDGPFPPFALKSVDPDGRIAASAAHVVEQDAIAHANQALAHARAHGWLVILIFNCQRGTEGNNRFGPDPKPFSY